MTTFVKCFIESEEGATVIEYALLIGLLSVVVIGVVVSLASYMNGSFAKVHSEMANGGIPRK